MEELAREIEKLRGGEVGNEVSSRMAEFRELGGLGHAKIFSELCFCITTANFNAERSIRIQNEMDNLYLSAPEKEVAIMLRKFGHRFPESRAGYIAGARKQAVELFRILGSCTDSHAIREWVAGNVKGIGYKEASHFLRNIGYTDLAIIDFHIIDVLERHGLIERPRTLTKKKYLEIESKLRELAARVGMNLAELDLYLWYMETGKILK